MRWLILFVLPLALSCGSVADAIRPDIPADMAALHALVHENEVSVLKDLEDRVLDAYAIGPDDSTTYFIRMLFIKDHLNEFAQWLRKSGLDARVYDAVVVRLRVWEDMQVFFCLQEDAYFVDKTPLDEGTKAQVLKYLDYLSTASDQTEQWIEEKGVIDD